MNPSINFSESNKDHLRKRQIEKLLAWAESVFSEPRPDGDGINPRLYEHGYISQEQEAVLYRDLHSRDSEVGLGLLDWRKAELLDSIAYLTAAIMKREHAAALARSRRDALERLTTGAQVAESYYVQPQAELSTAIDRLEMELSFLRAHGSKIDALERIIKLVGNESALRVPRAAEQMLRLFSQSWRGLVKIKSWSLHFENNAHLPVLQPYKQPGEPAGFLLPLSEDLRAVAISRDTAGYLLHMLEAIDVMAEAYRDQVSSGRLSSTEGWGLSHTLIRAIIEVFYFCNFELPFSYVDLAVDPEDPTQLWVFDYQNNTWQIVVEDVDSSRTLKRVGAEAAQLLINGGALLKCRRDDDLSAIIEDAAPQVSSPGETHNYRLFMCSGLSEFDLDPANQRIKFRMAFNSMNQLLRSIVGDQPTITYVGGSMLGGPLETLLGMALLDSRAFSLPASVKGPDPIVRFQIISQFWRRMGRRRAIAMLGEDYVKQVTGGLASLGEQGPEHPTFLTMRAGVFGSGAEARRSLTGLAAMDEPPVNPFAALGLSDQIRMLDLTLQSWAIADEMLTKLRDVHSQGKLKRVIDSVTTVVGARKESIEHRFNLKWLTANNWYWTFMRTCTPVAWDFWTKIGSNEVWDQVLLDLPPYQALGLLLRLFGDTVRLLMIIELSDVEVSQSLSIESESAGHTIVQGLEGLMSGGRLSPQLAEAISFYFDPEIRFDTWLAFTSSFRRYLAQMGQDLRTLNVDGRLLSSIDLLMAQLEILYPVREIVKEPEAEAAGTIEEAEAEPLMDLSVLNLLFIDEAEANRIEYLATQLLGRPKQDDRTVLKLISIAANFEKRELLALAFSHSSTIAKLLPNRAHRVLLFNMPSTSRKFFDFLNGLSENEAPTPEALDEVRPQVDEHFRQLSELYNTLVPLTEQIPNILPADRERLIVYLNSSAQRNTEELKNTSLNFLLMFACDRLILSISEDEELRVHSERAESKVRSYLRGPLGAQIEEPSIEIYPIGGGRILTRHNQCILSASNDGIEPFWSELFKPYSQALYACFISTKLALAAELLKTEFPEYNFLVR
jgi:hypothetical protein